jgi:hypothetical protein
MLIDCRGRKAGPKPTNRVPAVQAGHEPYAWRRERRYHVCEILSLDPNVAVRHHDDIMAGTVQHIDKIRNFSIAAMEAWVDHELDVVIRKPFAETPYHRPRRIGRIVDAKDELDAAAGVLAAERG